MSSPRPQRRQVSRPGSSRGLGGSRAVEIARAAEESGAGLIVVASLSGGPSETILLGSTAQRVQHSAPCPVLVSRPEQPA